MKTEEEIRTQYLNYKASLQACKELHPKYEKLIERYTHFIKACELVLEDNEYENNI